MDTSNWINMGLLVVTIFSAVIAWNNKKKIQKQLEQDIFPDLVINSRRKVLDISALNGVKLPLANVGLGVAKNFAYKFEIITTVHTYDPLISSLSISRQQNRHKYINFLLPAKTISNESSLTVYSEYIKLLKEYFIQNPNQTSVPTNFPTLSITIYYTDLKEKEFTRNYELALQIQKINQNNRNLITFLFQVKHIT